MRTRADLSAAEVAYINTSSVIRQYPKRAVTLQRKTKMRMKCGPKSRCTSVRTPDCTIPEYVLQKRKGPDPTAVPVF